MRPLKWLAEFKEEHLNYSQYLVALRNENTMAIRFLLDTFSSPRTLFESVDIVDDSREVNLEAVKMVYEKYPECFDFQDFIYRCSEKNRADPLFIFPSSVIRLHVSSTVVCRAALFGSRHVIEFLDAEWGEAYRQRFVWGKALRYAAAHGNMDVITYLVENMMQCFNDDDMDEAIRAALKMGEVCIEERLRKLRRVVVLYCM